MSANSPFLSRRATLLMALGVGIGLSPVGFPQVTADGILRFDPPAAWAKDGEDDEEDREDDREDEREDREDEREDEQEDERDDEEDDSSGRGNDDESEDEDESEDNSGKDDGSDDNDTDGDSSGPGGGDDSSSQPGRNVGDTPRSDDDDEPSSGSARVRDISVLYPDGWVERIVNGQYELIDNLNRQVIRRSATPGDFNRMYALR